MPYKTDGTMAVYGSGVICNLETFHDDLCIQHRVIIVKSRVP